MRLNNSVKLVRSGLLLPLAALLLAACSSQPDAPEQTKDDSYDRETAGGRYSMRQDKAPGEMPDMSHVKDAVPRFEPYSRRGNKDYNVWGQDYEVWREVENYRDEGMASWYGAKFHGHDTSNGEVYDMYTMTAAHKNLPLPSFVKVTNTANGRQVIVRVNDRGPFHDGRIIDLSYAAAWKLGMLDKGTAPVKIELIKMSPGKQDSLLANKATGRHIQLLATRSGDKARALAARLSKEYGFPARVEQRSDWYRLQMGPIPATQTDKILTRLVAEGFEQAYFLN
ncbi:MULTISPECIES: septal ring lytic transglycosylase RlpA family protein [Oceanimonas]|uniref:Endolytic peptidoglycan transglycosylase RlpA n=1 Tax=Oceanimonas smirnovii TaxID=264574 RepID=A0ABW7P205_9GAMM|nr:MULTISPECIES: septal ring lytic transglycosylase RlpA family protein [Oceanimonas]MDV2858056.1 septal ring lytic transglycosylase RlpA family protein [Oceanimonas sp. CAM02]